MKKYILDQFNRGFYRITHWSYAAPRPDAAPMIDGPGSSQAITDSPYPRPAIDFSQAGPVLELSARLHNRPAVGYVPIRQNDYFPPAPRAPVGAKTVSIPDQRLGLMQYPENGARLSYVFGQMKAPARQQSVPGYIVKQRQITRASDGYPVSAMKAPRPKTGGGQCRT